MQITRKQESIVTTFEIMEGDIRSRTTIPMRKKGNREESITVELQVAVAVPNLHNYLGTYMVPKPDR
jgi:hypothetical protein